MTKLQLIGLETFDNAGIIFIHENEYAAVAMHELCANGDRAKKHPWGDELRKGAHVAWTGETPELTDWSSLLGCGIERAYIVANNSKVSKELIPTIARELKGITVFAIEFTKRWPEGFSLAQEFPEGMFFKIGQDRYYSGPPFRAVTHPATWATDMVRSTRGKSTAFLRDEFNQLWIYAEQTDRFYCSEMPEINYDWKQFNALTGIYSHVKNTADLVLKKYKGRTARVAYKPDDPYRIITDMDTSAINVHTPSNIVPLAGDPAPWLDFMTYLIPDEDERALVLKWCATLIAKPDVRILYGLLLVSETQGIGKTTLGERILAPLVGMHNAGFPGERDIVDSPFNSWSVNKRLLVVAEIYTGHSWKAYNVLKSLITDKYISVNEKHIRQYTIENWVHIIACSNSRKALRIEETDRRWFYPNLTPVKWPDEQWVKFYRWLHGGGLNIIAHWAGKYGKYVLPGEPAPMTAIKRELIKDSKSNAVQKWNDVLEAVEEGQEEVAFACEEAREAIRQIIGEKVYENAKNFAAEALARGWKIWPARLRIDGALSWIVMSPTLGTMHSDAELRARVQRVADRLPSKH